MRKKIKFLLAIIMMLVGATTACAATVHTSGRVYINHVGVGDIIKQDCQIRIRENYSLEIYDTDGTTLLQQYSSSGNVQPGYDVVVTESGTLVKLRKIANGAAVTSVTLNQSSLPLIEGGETATLIATVNANDDALNLVSWSSSETSVATVNNNGVVTPVAPGTATITVTSLWDNTKTATCTVTVAATYTVTLKEGTEDADNWTGKIGDATTYQAFPLEGVTATQTVTVKYDGTRKVKSVKAVKAKLPSTVTSAPTATCYITTGSNTALVNAGTAEGGTMMYAVTSSNTEVPEKSTFSAAVPTVDGRTVGTYYVWYYVKGNDYYIDSEIGDPVVVTVTVPATLADAFTEGAEIRVKANMNTGYQTTVTGTYSSGSYTNVSVNSIVYGANATMTKDGDNLVVVINGINSITITFNATNNSYTATTTAPHNANTFTNLHSITINGIDITCQLTQQ